MNIERIGAAIGVPEVARVQPVLSLAERLETQPQPTPVSTADDTPADDGDVPFPLPMPVTDRSAVRRWAVQLFMEKMLYGEEEETGVMPLTID